MVLVALYVPALVFAHLFAGFWLVRMLLIVQRPGGSRASRRGAAAAASTAQDDDKAADGAALGPAHPAEPASHDADGFKAPQGSPTAAAFKRLAGVAHGGGGATAAAAAAAAAAGAASSSGSTTPAAGGSGRGGAGAAAADDGGADGARTVVGAVPSKDSQLVLRRLTSALRPLALEWRGVGCAYATSRGPRAVLRDVYGRAAPGEMLALMGPSGAGKSTLLDILSARKRAGRVTGEVLVDGAPRPPDFAARAVYVPQGDGFLPAMTVRETADYHAALLLPGRWGRAARNARVSQVLAAMGLSHAGDTLVGGLLPGGITLRGVSGGERKRLSIAVGIVSTPALVFLDEPTSGLDSFAALSVMRYMQLMAHRGGHTVVASIHQPRAAIWAMFDAVTLLSAGLLMYHGPRDGLVPWFGSLGYPYDAETHGIASDWAMDLVNVGFHRKPEAFYGRMVSTRAELRAASAAFVARYLADAGAAAAEEGRGGGGGGGSDSSGAGSGADAGGSGGAQGQPGAAGAFDSPAGSFTSAATSTAFADFASCTSRAASDAGGVAPPRRPAEPAALAPPVGAPPVLLPPVGAAGAGAGAAAVPPLPADRAAAFQSVVDRAASRLQQAPPPQQHQQQPGQMQQQQHQQQPVWHRRLHRGAREHDGSAAAAAVAAAPPSRAGWGRQFRVLLWRELLAVTRNPADVAGRMLVFAYISALLGLIFYDLGASVSALRARLNALFLQPVIFMLLPYVYMSLFTADKQYYVADAAARLYRPSAYYAAKQAAVLPFAALNVAVFALTLYGMAGLRPTVAACAANFGLSALLYLIAAQVLALAAAVTPNQDAAFMVAIAWTAVNLLMSNFMVRFVDMTQVWLSQLRWVSAMGYAFDGFATAEFAGASYGCADGLAPDVVGFLPALLPNTAAVASPLVRDALLSPGADCAVDLDAVLAYFGAGRPLWATALILLAYLLVCHGLTFGAYVRLARREAR